MLGDDDMLVHRVSGHSNGSSLAARSGTSIRRNRHLTGPLGWRRVAIALPVAACNTAPTPNPLGSHLQFLAVAGISDCVVAPLLTYAGLAMSATLLAWLLWFGH
jgi:hypothetical protein